MKKLVGGDYLLDLTPIELEESEDGETYTSITNKEIIEQLTNLKKFVPNPSMVKPVWVKLKNGETDEIVVVRGEFKVVDAGEFEIVVAIDGYKLKVHIEFTQALNENNDPIDDWYIDTNDAKYLFTSELQNINAITSSGDLSSVKADEIIENMSGYGFTKLSETTNLTREFVYAGIVKNGNKLTFVLAVNLTRTGDVAENVSPKLGAFSIPASMKARIYPSQIGGYSYVSVGEINAWRNDNSNKPLQVYSYLGSEGDNTIYVDANPAPINELTGDIKYYCRWELTLLLSDNLVPEQAGE